MSDTWTPDQPLRDDATDEQIGARFRYYPNRAIAIAREFAAACEATAREETHHERDLAAAFTPPIDFPPWMELPEVVRARRGLRCLYIEAPGSVAREVEELVEAAFSAITTPATPPEAR